MTSNWLALVTTLPTSPSAVRVRTWRALKASGCGALRDGVYLLPDRPGCEQLFADLATAVRAADGEATVLAFAARDAEQQAQFEALFDRSAEFKAFEVELAQQRRSLRSATEVAGRRTLRALAQRLDALRAIDFVGRERGPKAAAALETLRLECEARWSLGEPTGAQKATIDLLNPADYQGRIWATRQRPWVDRLASAWLIRRFVDPSARFVWLTPKAKLPKSALGFDFDGATFTHVAGKVTFEVIAASFGLDDDPTLGKIGEAVHYIDVGGAASDEAAGLEAMMRGLQAQHADDDALLAGAESVFDALYAGLRGSE
jgi:hypothetical protein